MSGNKSRTKSEMLRVLLISANTERINMPTLPLGLGCVAEAARRAGHEIKLLDLMGTSDPHPIVESAVIDFSPDVIGISLRNIDDQKMEDTRVFLNHVKDVITVCRSLSGAPIVLGGAGYSIFPESALDYLQADMGIQGEGEAAFASVLDRLEKKASLSGIPGLYIRGSGLQNEKTYVQDLDSLPLPDADYWAPSYASDPAFLMPVHTRRGCSMDCSYCSTATIEGKGLRKRSPEAVIEWMAGYAEQGFRRFFFTDNTFNLPASYAKELCRQMQAAGLDVSWRCIIYPVRLDEELVKAMAGAGCTEVSLGFESGSERMLHAMHKKFSPEDIRHTSEMLKKHSIRQTGFLLLGGPGETKESVEESFAFADSLKLDLLKITVGIRIYPNTPLAHIAVKEGIITQDDTLLVPKFYLKKDIEEWLRTTVEKWLAQRPNWFA
jgi:radical SAM superfamily enzyme YgiQ (UPF0313 family)